MNATTAVFFIAAAIASASAFAGERAGRDSVYAKPGLTLSAPTNTARAAVDRNGRSSIYAKDLTIRPRSQAQYARVIEKAGRA